jgi:hypothetical protein
MIASPPKLAIVPPEASRGAEILVPETRTVVVVSLETKVVELVASVAPPGMSASPPIVAIVAPEATQAAEFTVPETTTVVVVTPGMGKGELVAAVPPPGMSPPVVAWGHQTGEPIAETANITQLMNFRTMEGSDQIMFCTQFHF